MWQSHLFFAVCHKCTTFLTFYSVSGNVCYASQAPMSLRTARVTDALHQSHGNFMRSCVKRIKREVFTYSAFYFGQDGLNWVHSNNSCLPTIYSQAQVNRLTYIEVYVLMPSQPLAPHVPHKQSFFPSIPLFLSPISNTLIHNNNLLPPPPSPPPPPPAPTH